MPRTEASAAKPSADERCPVTTRQPQPPSSVPPAVVEPAVGVVPVIPALEVPPVPGLVAPPPGSAAPPLAAPPGVPAPPAFCPPASAPPTTPPPPPAPLPAAPLLGAGLVVKQEPGVAAGAAFAVIRVTEPAARSTTYNALSVPMRIAVTPFVVAKSFFEL